MVLVSYKKKFLFIFISKQTHYGSADQNYQMILKVTIEAVHHLAIHHLELLLNEKRFHVPEPS